MLVFRGVYKTLQTFLNRSEFVKIVDCDCCFDSHAGSQDERGFFKPQLPQLFRILQGFKFLFAHHIRPALRKHRFSNTKREDDDNTSTTSQPGHRCQCTHTGHSLWIIPPTYSIFVQFLFRPVSTCFTTVSTSRLQKNTSSGLSGAWWTATTCTVTLHQLIKRCPTIQSHHCYPSTACPCDR